MKLLTTSALARVGLQECLNRVSPGYHDARHATQPSNRLRTARAGDKGIREAGRVWRTRRSRTGRRSA
jgi:hypothetical protein